MIRTGLIGITSALITLGVAAAQTTSPVTTTNGGTVGKVPVFTSATNLENSSSPIYVNSTNGYVGIGTTSPSFPLEVDGAAANGTPWNCCEITEKIGPLEIGFDNRYNGIAFGNVGDPGGFSFNSLTSSNTMMEDAYIGSGDTWFAGTATLSGEFWDGFLYAPTYAGTNTGTFTIANFHPTYSSFTNTGTLIGLNVDPGTPGGTVYSAVFLDGNVGIGTSSPGKRLDVSGTIRTSAAGSDTGGVVYPDGSQQTTAWTGVLCGGDYAEDMRTKGDKAKYEPGDVLVLASGDNSDVQKTAKPYSTLVAGIYATKPGVVGRRAAVVGSNANVPMAMVGVVPTKVSAKNGPIHKGDLLVTSSIPGYAMKGTDRSRMLGAVLGKAMGSLSSGKGVIEVLVTLQ